MKMKPTSFRLPADTLDRIKALTQPGESQASVILRGLTVLEGSPPPLSLEAVASRVESIEHRLSALEYSRSASVVQTDADLILRVQGMKASGMIYPSIAEALNAEGVVTKTGKPWNKDSIFRLLKDATNDD
jgi:hypothetical protein